MKDDEKQFLVTVYKHRMKHRGGTDHLSPREIINGPRFSMHYKRAWYLLEKWTDKGWYDYSVTEDMGWLTETGEGQARALIEETAEA